MIRFNFNLHDFEDSNKEDKEFSSIENGACLTYFNMFKNAGIPVVNPMHDPEEFQFDIEENIDESIAEKIKTLIKDMGFEISYDRDDNWFKIRDRGQPEWNDVLQVRYMNSEYKNEFKFAGDEINDVVSDLLICCDDVNNAVRLVMGL